MVRTSGVGAERVQMRVVCLDWRTLKRCPDLPWSDPCRAVQCAGTGSYSSGTLTRVLRRGLAPGRQPGLGW